jgi:hypothetical protein
MSKRIALAAAIAVAATGSGVAAADEVSELKAAVQALQQRIDQLESKAKEAEDTNDRQTDQLAKQRSAATLPSAFTWKGDLRYRNENIEQEYAKNRNRDRIRVRTGFTAKVNDTITTEVGLSTSEGNDPRSSNQTLTGENTRKAIELDVAYVTWQPHADWKLTAGKMKYPWVRPGQSVLFDGDINPEGLAVNFAHGLFFASAFYNLLEERGGSLTAASADSNLAGAQAGLRGTLGSRSKWTLGAGYFDFNAVQGRNPFYNNSSNGNTTTTTASLCQPGIPTAAPGCLRWDFTQKEVFGEFSTLLGSLPLSAHADWLKNDDAGNGLDTAYSVGVLLGKASDPHTWEIGYVFQHIEKDALYAQFIDSDFGGGNTDSEGSILKGAYAFAKNWTLNLTYFLNKTNIDVPVTVAGVGPVLDRDYKRLQIDLNWKY